jgi:hypothetical protein
MNWETQAASRAARYEVGAARLPADPTRRARQLLKMATAAGAVGLARLMLGEDGAGWFRRSADAYRESYALAPPESWGRVVGAVKAAILAGDARDEAVWALALLGGKESSIARYGDALARLALGRDDARSLSAVPDFPPDVAAALDALGARDAAAYRAAVASVLASFESREEFLEDLPVADTVLVLEALATERGIAAELRSALLPRRGARSDT